MDIECRVVCASGVTIHLGGVAGAATGAFICKAGIGDLRHEPGCPAQRAGTTGLAPASLAVRCATSRFFAFSYLLSFRGVLPPARKGTRARRRCRLERWQQQRTTEGRGGGRGGGSCSQGMSGAPQRAVTRACACATAPRSAGASAGRSSCLRPGPRHYLIGNVT